MRDWSEHILFHFINLQTASKNLLTRHRLLKRTLKWFLLFMLTVQPSIQHKLSLMTQVEYSFEVLLMHRHKMSLMISASGYILITHSQHELLKTLRRKWQIAGVKNSLWRDDGAKWHANQVNKPQREKDIKSGSSGLQLKTAVAWFNLFLLPERRLLFY